MGLSLVAFGSSVPDCLSSLFVAQKGEAVTNSTKHYRVPKFCNVCESQAKVVTPAIKF